MVGPPAHSEGDLEQRISAAVARLYLDTFGKGPLHAVTFINGDVVTTVLHEVFTGAELAMVAGGRADSVLTTRVLWQHATDAAFKDVIKAVTGRRVLTVVSGFELQDDVATEVFVLESR